MSFLTDEHVPSVFVTALRSNGHDVVTANGALGEATDDRTLLEHCRVEGHVLVTNDRKDFAGPVGEDVTHAGIVIYTNPNYLRDDPEGAVRVVERVLSHYPPSELRNELVWIDQWR